jgi:hypothetical protein
VTDLTVDTTASQPLPSRLQRFVAGLGRLRLTRLGLRTRVLLMFSFGALLLAIFLAAAAYSFTRSSLVTQRDRAAVTSAGRNSTVAAAELSGEPVDADGAIRRLGALGVDRTVIFYRGEWRAGDPLRHGQDQIPPSLFTRVID